MSQETLHTSTTTSLNQIQKSSAANSAAGGPNSTIDPLPGPSSASRPVANLLNVMQTQSQQMQNRVQDVRVDNWGNYCLQRLQVMYDRGDFCDLTIQFHNNQILKVHRVVVNLCTEYFANLERMFGLSDGCLLLPKDIEYQAMVTIVKFFYTGKLEVRGSQFNDIYKTVKLMNITILTKLLEAHARKPIMQAKKEPTRPIVFKQAVEIGRPLSKAQLQLQNATQPSPGGSITLSGGTHIVTGTGGNKTLAMPPGMKLPPGVKTKTVLARVQPQTMRFATQQQTTKIISQKKLPIWKERKFSPAQQPEPLMWPPKEEPARPTRFEWADPEDDPPYVTAAAHTLMEKQKAAANTRRAEDIFDAVKNQNLGLKRSIASVPMAMKHDPEEPPINKVPKMENVHNMMTPVSQPSTDTGVEQNDVNLTEETVEEIVSTTSEREAEEHTVEFTQPMSNSIQLDMQGTSVQSSFPIKGVMKSETVLTKSIPGTSSLAKPTHGHTKIEKSVRFAPEVEKENKLKSGTTEIVVPTDANDPLSNHSKIISEVLKKYPDLVKENKNIKLKIVQKGADSSQNKESKSKVSYIVLKSTSSPDSPGSVVLKKPVVNTNKTFWQTETPAEKVSPRKIISGAENTSGPWLCGPCGGGDETPMEFESYYLYRRHLVEVHGERIDARICEYCGQKASKRNLLLYHLYTKHGVPPPKNCTFPHCDRCDYVALSESLLSKHKQSHDINKEFSCTVCNASFKSSNALQGHMAANLHRNKDTKVYECPYCRKPFVRNINLKAHIRSLHKDVARIEEMEDPRLPPDDSLANRPVAIVHAGSTKKRQFPSILAGAHIRGAVPGSSGAVLISSDLPDEQRMGQVSLVTADGSTIEILHGMDPSMSVPVSLVQSSDESMNVSNSLAASLGLETHGGHPGTEFVGVGPDGAQAVYIVDSSQGGVEVDMSGVAMGVSADGSMILDGEDPTGSGQFIVQDIHGNRFQRITGIDENGKQVIFFQLSEDNGQMPGMIDENGMHIAGTAQYEDGTPIEGGATYEYVPVSDGDSGPHTAFGVQNDHMYLDPQKCSVFVSSGMTMPVAVTTDGVVGQPAQVILSTNAHGGRQIMEMIPSQSDQHHQHHHQQHHQQHVVVEESVLAEHQQQVEEHQRQLSLVHQQDGMQHIVHDSMGQPVQELHIVLDDNLAEIEGAEPQADDSQNANSSGKQILGGTQEQLEISENYEHTEQVIVGDVIDDGERDETVQQESVDSSEVIHGDVIHVTDNEEGTMLVIQDDDDTETQVVEMVEEICEEETQTIHEEDNEETVEEDPTQEISHEQLHEHEQVMELIEEETITMTEEEIPVEMEVTETDESNDH